MTTSFAKLIAAGLLLVATTPARAETPASLCGSKPEMVDIMMRIIEKDVEKLYSDSKMFVSRDNRDGSLWAVTLPHTTVHPAVVCQTTAQEVAILCTSGENSCASFKEQAMARFEKVDPGAK